MRRIALAATATLALAGCDIPLPEVPDAPELQFPSAVTLPQSDTVIAETFAELALADEERDADLLGSRVGGDAATVREAEYKLAAGDDLRTAFSDDILAVYATSQEVWPRVFVGVTEAPGEALTPVLMVWEQDELRTPYQLRYWAHMVPGAVLPAMPGQALGTTVRDADDGDSLQAVPNDVIADYVSLLTAGEDAYAKAQQEAEEALAAPEPTPSPSASADPDADESEPDRVPVTFAPDNYREQMFAARSSLNKAAKARSGSYADEITARVDDSWVLDTAEGGVLVFVPVDIESRFRVPGAQLILPTSDKRILDGKLEDNVVYHYSDFLVFHVPAADSDGEIAVVAADHHLVKLTD